MSKKDLFEIADTQSSAQFEAHKAMIKKMQSNGYKISYHDKREEHGLDQELLAKVEETILDPPISSLPIIKFEARQVFGHYNFNDAVFKPLDTPKFELKSYKKGAELHQRNDPWDKFEM
jgi:uncharacterized lipoprotein YajG